MTVVNNYFWDFGDGETSTDQNPEHIYSMPGTYTATLTVTDVLGDTHDVEYTIYAYDMDYAGSGETPSQYDIDHSYRLQQGLAYARVVTHSDKCYRYAIPQEQSQGAGWTEYNGDYWPMAVGLTGCSTILDRNDEKVSLVIDAYSFKEYQLGKDDWWVDGGNADYAGSEYEAEILLRENVNPNGATSRLKHSQSRVDFKPWWKDRRGTATYNDAGFKDSFNADLFVRKDSTPYDAAITKQIPQEGQLVFDRNIESTFLQMGLKVRGAPWRMTYAEQQYISRDTGANPRLKAMSELGWSLLAAEPLLWIGRDSSIENPTLPINAGTGVQVTGSYSALITGPDGLARSAYAFGAADSFTAEDVPQEGAEFSLMMWLRSPTSGMVLWESSEGDLRVVYTVNPDGTRKIEYFDSDNHFNINLSVETSDWFMLTIVRDDDVLIAYENASLINTYGLVGIPDDVYGDITVCQGSCAAWGMRMIPRVLTAEAVTYHYNDVVENQANATENIF